MDFILRRIKIVLYQSRKEWSKEMMLAANEITIAYKEKDGSPELPGTLEGGLTSILSCQRKDGTHGEACVPNGLVCAWQRTGEQLKF